MLRPRRSGARTPSFHSGSRMPRSHLPSHSRCRSSTASRADARYGVRARELAIVADVTAAHHTLKTAEQTSALQEQNSAKARLELKFTQDRYSNGQVTFVDLTEARAAYERAESDRINAIYAYHKAFAALESAVGRQLR